MRFEETKKGKDVWKHEHFDSIGDLLTYINTAPIARVFNGRTLHSRSKNFGSNWYGTESYEEALGLLQNGWAPEAAKLSEKLPIHTAQSNFNSSRPTHSVVGYQASVPRYLQGIPQNMVTTKTTPKKQKIITIYKGLSYNCGVTSKQIEDEGIKALQIIQNLEGRGYRVKLVTGWVTRVIGEVRVMTLTVKRPEERLSLIKMAFPLIHPSMLRRIGFAWLEHQGHDLKYEFIGGYGRSDWSIFKAEKPGEIVLPDFIEDIKNFKIEEAIK